MRKFNLFMLIFVISVLCHSCMTKDNDLVFDPYINVVPDSTATPEQIKIKKALYEIIYTKVSVKGGRYVPHFNKEDFRKLGVSEKYCKWLKNYLREESRNTRKTLRETSGCYSDSSWEKAFESAKKEYLETVVSSAQL